MPEHDKPYSIDYANLDVADLMRQVRDRARRIDVADAIVPVSSDLVERRLRGYFDLDDSRPHEVQEALGLAGSWNVSPGDLRSSHPGALGSVIVAVRGLLRPLTKLLANLDLPLHKQNKINLGMAAAVRDLLQENHALRRELAELSRRVESLERDHRGTGT